MLIRLRRCRHYALDLFIYAPFHAMPTQHWRQRRHVYAQYKIAERRYHARDAADARDCRSAARLAMIGGVMIF